ncbi:glutamyl-tRNA reductase [Leptospira perolatii]|uniref:Glutamyl-tRNA reductase n=1 Tax=Leptospira perolatii TaxID=2023191 RepID=A0A2M9ZPR2_9LEPT|nr:glutamyl-tRNA reductase [Leptospira perolatii]PJZ70753.1 glutamyl-tRNA reductase [Leptospira perolatii]PJZ73961.1 glutamyl-tRNA reductase [Leptospira perolatii]
MWSTLKVYHSETNQKEALFSSDAFLWKTCMRTIWVTDSRLHPEFISVSSSWEVRTGFEAYRLLLEIVSGLRSKLFGETEVLAQFKERFKNGELPSSAFGEYLAKLRDNLIEDSRELRSGYLQNLGEQSYGGLAHKYLSEFLPKSHSVSMIGTGQLAEKMLPWLRKSDRTVNLVGRNPNRLLSLSNAHPCKAVLLSDWQPAQEAWVIAAPIDLEDWMKYLEPGSLVLDFREEVLEKSWPEGVRYISFAEMLSSLKETEARTHKTKLELNSVIERLLEDREYEPRQFVFGWEDLPCPSF